MTYNSETTKPQKSLAIWGVIGALYITQGIPMGVAFGALPAILRREGYSTESIGMLGLVMLPWALKFLWAPFVDRHSGGSYLRRRQWIIPAQLVLAALLMTIAFLPQGQGISTALFILLLIANLVSATQDIVTDGLAIEVIPKGNFGWANSLQIGGFAVGMLLGGSVATVLYAWAGWLFCFGSLSVIILLTLVPILGHKSMDTDVDTAAAQQATRSASLRKFFSRKNAFYIISIAATFYFGRALAGSMTSPFLVDVGLSLSAIALINGIGITSLTIVSSGLGGLIINWFGVKPVAIVAGILAALSLSLWLVPAYYGHTGLTMIVAIVLINGITSGIAYVAFFTLFMQWASREQAGTDFSLLQSTETLTNILAAILGGVIAGAIGFDGNFMVAAGLALLMMAWITFALRRMTA